MSRVPTINFDSNDQQIPVVLKKIQPKKQPKVKPLPVSEITEGLPDDIISQVKLLKQKIKDKRSEIKKECSEKGIDSLRSQLSALVKQKNALFEQLF